MSPDFYPLLLASPLLVAIAVTDMTWMRIPNALVLAMLALFVLTAPFALTFQEVGIRVAVAVAVFGLGFVAFAFNVIAGGDVKALAALMLFVPSSALAAYGFTFSAALLIGIAITVALRRLVGSPESRFVSLATNTGIPMGVGIALSGLILPFVASA
jgi:prepilin peptidase CpaA